MATISLELVPPFLAVAELGSFSAAAVRLGVEKSSVSRAIARLEHSVGEQLFLRTTRRVTLTDAGQSVRDRLREPYAGLDAAVKAILDTAGSPRGRIAVTAPTDLGSSVVCDVLAQFVRRYPHVDVDMHLSNQFVDLVANNIDAAIRVASKRLKDSTLRARKLCDALIGIYAARSYAEARGLPRTLEEADNHQWVGLRSLRELPVQTPEGHAVLRFKPRVSCDDIAFAHQAVLRGIGIGMVPVLLAETDVREGRLVQVFPRWTFPGVPLWFLTPAGSKPSRATEAFREGLVEVFASRPSAFRIP